jgi:hypothetical protein
MAAALAARMEQDVGTSDGRAEVERAFWLVFSRPPHAAEASAALELIERHGTRAFCRALLNANEFMYVD